MKQMKLCTTPPPQLSMGIVDIKSLRYYNVTKSIISFDKKGNSRIPPPHYKVPNLHPRNYCETDQLKESENSERNIQTKNEAEEDPYPR